MKTVQTPPFKLRKVSDLNLLCTCKGTQEASGEIRKEAIKWVKYLLHCQNDPKLWRKHKVNDEGVIQWNIMFFNIKKEELK